ncbi:hypothetical protein IQ07DRAFT_148192 [Pyrenochaeta sp. DS3sAY3a]|nr:hypothetical protein IQ07DRAFT_148192 [Pyrenochaeta sp. DS3sAY3a]
MFSSNTNGYEGWEIYPQTLSFAQLELDPSRKNRQISRLSKELFVATDESAFTFLGVSACREEGTHEVVSSDIQSTEKLSAVMELGSETSAFFINQSYTWSRLLISEEHFRRLFTRLHVHPCFLDVVFLFQEKIRPVEEGLSSLFVDIVPQTSSMERSSKSHDCSYYIGYNIKYVAKHGRVVPKDPFSIREVGVYQHFVCSTQQCTWVILQASDQLKVRLKSAFNDFQDNMPAKQVLLHSMIILDVSEDWREYLVYLEDEFSGLVDKGFFTNIKEPQLEGDIVADFSDLRKLHILMDKLRRLLHILRLNIRIGSQLRNDMSRIKRASSSATQSIFEKTEANLDRYLFGQETSRDRIETVIARGSEICHLVQNIQDIRAAEVSKKTN